MQKLSVADRPDVVMVCLHTLEFSEAVAAFATEENIPLVVDVVDIWPEVYLRAFPRLLKNVAKRLLRSEFLRARRILESAGTITAVSQTYLDWALALCSPRLGRSSAMFPLGYDNTGVDDDAVRVESERLNLAHDLCSGSVNLAFVGQLSHSYDLETVVKAARLLYPSLGSKVRFFIAGDGVDRNRLEVTARDLPSVCFTGWLSHPGVIALLSRCTAGLVSYASDATQSLPYKPFEYMAAGLVLLSCLPGEMAQLIASNDVGIRALVSDPEGCAQMRENARTLFETGYRSKTIYNRLARFLEEVAPGISHQQATSLA
jgi:glycosyltransferase involved in cell wall biosynthesis